MVSSSSDCIFVVDTYKNNLSFIELIVFPLLILTRIILVSSSSDCISVVDTYKNNLSFIEF